MKKCFLILLLPVIAFSLGCDGARSNDGNSSSSTATGSTNQRQDRTNSQPQTSRTNDLTPGIGLSRKQPVEAKVDLKDLQVEASDSEFNLKFLSWNVESEGADGNVIAEQLASLNEGDRYDVIGLTEVLPKDLGKFRNALGKHYKYAYSKSGNNDRLQLLYNEHKFSKVRHFEIKEINLKNRYRAPLVVHLKSLNGSQEFLAMVNHLARGKAEVRQEQAKMLVEWARNETLPVIAVGDYNFDYVFSTKQGNPAFASFMRDNIWSWVQPEEMIDTNWYDNPREPDGKDDYPGSMLDFGFVSNGAKDWKRICRVIVRKNDFPDDETTSDHRPFELLFQVGNDNTEK